MSLEEMTIAVHGGDPLSRAGLIGYLEQQQRTAVLTRTDATLEEEPEDVAVVLADQIDASAAARLRELVMHRTPRVVLVTSELDDAQTELVVDAGVHSIVWRHQATEERLVKAIQAAGRDEGEIPGDLLRRVLAQLGRRRRDTSAPSVPSGQPTQREADVLKLVAEGLDTREIAGRLSYSERTVKGILHNVMARLQLRNRAHAVAFAIRQGHI
ncbi:helix-turn-helix transcriptional regulator [Streptomyces mirabilis]|uniref:helix-turn-helix transcriptional regulator n=1 Tax=Streptomyces mirabilis TaxID=68239 RepID=UPI0033BCB283